METYKLDEIADIMSGLSTSRKKGEEELDGKEVMLISVKDIDPESIQIRKDIGTSFKISDMKKLNKFVLNESDIVITSKGQSLRAAIYKESPTPIVPTSNLTLIRVRGNGIVLPDYLNVFLNSDRTIATIQSKLSGTSIMSLSKKDLSAVEVIVPSLEEQEKIVELALEKERFVKARKNEIKFMEVIVENTINKGIFKD